MTIVTFQEVRAGQEVHTFCRECRKPLKRKISEWRTLNPYNRTADGAIEDRSIILDEIGAKLTKRASEMERDGVICRDCATKPTVEA